MRGRGPGAARLLPARPASPEALPFPAEAGGRDELRRPEPRSPFDHPTVGDAPLGEGRVVADGKHLELGGRPFRVRGVTYGGFRRRSDGAPFPEPDAVEADLAEIARAGFNTVRTYDLPSEDLLETAASHGLRVLAGVHYEDWRQVPADRRGHRMVLDRGRRAVQEAVERCAGRSEVLALSVGNEVPADLVRLHGPRRVEDALSSLVAEAHDGAPDLLVTYTNFPTTEYLRVEGLDLACFNVFLEDPERLRSYLRRLQVITPGLPVVVTELGLAAEVHGEEEQARSLAAQLRVVDEEGCAGAAVFSWTDEWAVADYPVRGWGFGLTDERRRPKPALEVARRWTHRSLADLRAAWPRISVVVCAHDEEAVIGECLDSLRRSPYPDLEVLVCDDGSTDSTADRAADFGNRVLRLPHGGLSRARNAGLVAATGEIVAYLDADATCHPTWPFHLALALEEPGVGGAGGPNLPVPGAGLVERAVASSPGGPTEVLLTDDRAEHVPGCNMAFRREVLEAVDGFDPLFTSAGDDVDLCWKVLAQDRAIAFSPAAQVRHHRRRTVRGYLRQQRGYGRAERLVAARHRHRFNRLGQARWRGVVYGGLRSFPRLIRPVVYHGPMGLAPYQGVDSDPADSLMSWTAALLPLAVPLLVAGVAFGSLWPPAFVVAGVALLATALYAAAAGTGVRPERGERRPTAFRALVAFMHLAQPMVRTWGRLTTFPPTTERGSPPRDPPARRLTWNGDRACWLRALGEQLASRRCAVRFGGPHDGWDLRVALGPTMRARVTTAVLWGWVPLWKVRLRPRPLAWLLLVAGAALSAAGLWVGWAVVGALLIGSVLEALVLRRRVAVALAITSEGSKA